MTARLFMDQLLYTVSQCCRLIAIGRTTFYELVACGEIPVRKVGNKTLVAAADLKRWAERLPAVKAGKNDQLARTACSHELVP
jgi:excisionase family DNA binding protein